jgi:ADP-ribose pyrophosphatase
MTKGNEPVAGRWETLGSERGEEMPLFRVRYDWVRNPRNRREMRRLVLESVDWVNVVAITRDGDIVMVQQHRFGIGKETVETPGGLVDPGESPRDAAERELLEETGYSGGEWSYLGAVEPNPAFHDHLCHHWLARDVELTTQPLPGPGESIVVRLMDLEGIREEMQSGRLQHVLALSALGRVFPLWANASQANPEPP